MSKKKIFRRFCPYGASIDCSGEVLLNPVTDFRVIAPDGYTLFYVPGWNTFPASRKDQWLIFCTNGAFHPNDRVWMSQ